MSKSVFKFKNFNVIQTEDLHKVGTDAMILGASIICDCPKAILDVGTGCGVLALMLAQSFPKARLVGVDIDINAVSLADENFKYSHFQNHFTLEMIDFLNYYSSTKFDLIVSNPPYFNSNMPSKILQRNLARHEDSMTVIELINHAEQLLTKNGELWIIIPKERTDGLLQNQERLNLLLTHRISIFGKPNRHVRDILVFSSKNNRKDLPISLIIRDENGEYTKQYKSLTKSYHYREL